MTPPEGVKRHPGYQNDSTAKHIGMTYAVIQLEIFGLTTPTQFNLPNSEVVLCWISLFMNFEFHSLLHFSFTFLVLPGNYSVPNAAVLLLLFSKKEKYLQDLCVQCKNCYLLKVHTLW